MLLSIPSCDDIGGFASSDQGFAWTESLLAAEMAGCGGEVVAGGERGDRLAALRTQAMVN